MELYVARHGRVPSNDEGIISGRNAEELTQMGILQAESIREQLQEIDFAVIYSSNVKRAIQTAEIINKGRNLEIKLDERLAERDPGTMLGKKRKEINKEIWNSLSLDKTPENAETLKAGLIRTRSILNEIHSTYPNEKVLIVTHNFICKCIWMIEDEITDLEQINNFYQENNEVKKYCKK